MAILPPRPAGAPSPFSGNLIIFGVGPRASSNQPSQSASAAGSASTESDEDDMQGKSEEAQRDYRQALSALRPSTDKE